ncbi:MAG: hypothetical protein ABSF82_07545 [Candidatus Bathyarchaeia archaeon]
MVKTNEIVPQSAMTLLSQLKGHPNRIGMTIGFVILLFIIVYVVLHQRAP